MRGFQPRVWLIGLVAAVACARARAGDELGHFHLFARHHQNKAGTPPPGTPRDFDHTDERAGYPRTLSNHLEPSVTSGGIGYYIGGGASFGHGKNEGPYRTEGTWGWDETGCSWFRRRVVLGWSHGRRYQGGTGAYRTDGPVVPDVIQAFTSTVNSLGRREGGEGHE